jgi:hypothetical protein
VVLLELSFNVLFSMGIESSVRNRFRLDRVEVLITPQPGCKPAFC